MTTPDHDESKPRRRWPTYVAVVLVLLLLYPLSVGPVVVIAGRWKNDTFITIAGMFYVPLSYAAKSTGTHDAIDAYAAWCCRKTNTERP